MYRLDTQIIVCARLPYASSQLPPIVGCLRSSLEEEWGLAFGRTEHSHMMWVLVSLRQVRRRGAIARSIDHPILERKQTSAIKRQYVFFPFSTLSFLPDPPDSKGVAERRACECSAPNTARGFNRRPHCSHRSQFDNRALDDNDSWTWS